MVAFIGADARVRDYVSAELLLYNYRPSGTVVGYYGARGYYSYQDREE